MDFLRATSSYPPADCRRPEGDQHAKRDGLSASMTALGHRRGLALADAVAEARTRTSTRCSIPRPRIRCVISTPTVRPSRTCPTRSTPGTSSTKAISSSTATTTPRRPTPTSRSWTVGNPTLKLGLLNNLDVEVNFSLYNSIRTATVSTGASTISQGFGDTFTRFKWNLFGNDGGGPALALIPYAKWPTAPIFPQGIGQRLHRGRPDRAAGRAAAHAASTPS